MPNWVSHNVKIIWDQKDLEKFKEEVASDDNEFDLNKILPMPDNIFKGNLWLKEKEIYWKNNWYDWSIENWGTKWNSCEANYIKSNNNSLYLFFQTALSTPIWIWETIAKKYKTLVFEIEFADEDIWSNCWIINIEKWELSFISNDWDYEFAAEVLFWKDDAKEILKEIREEELKNENN